MSDPNEWSLDDASRDDLLIWVRTPTGRTDVAPWGFIRQARLFARDHGKPVNLELEILPPAEQEEQARRAQEAAQQRQEAQRSAAEEQLARLGLI